MKIQLGTNALRTRIENYRGEDREKHIRNFNNFAKRMQRLADALSNIISYDDSIREALILWNKGIDIVDDEVKIVKKEVVKEDQEDKKEEKKVGEPVMTPNDLQKEEVKVFENERRE